MAHDIFVHDCFISPLFDADASNSYDIRDEAAGTLASQQRLAPHLNLAADMLRNWESLSLMSSHYLHHFSIYEQLIAYPQSMNRPPCQTSYFVIHAKEFSPEKILCGSKMLTLQATSITKQSSLFDMLSHCPAACVDAFERHSVIRSVLSIPRHLVCVSDLHLTGSRSEGPFEVAPTVYYLAGSGASGDVYLAFACSGIYATLSLTPKAADQQHYFRLGSCNVALADQSLTTNNTGSDACVDFILSQLKRCQDTHTKCKSMRPSRQGINHFLPTRLIDVGHSGTKTICLVETDNSAGETGYIALSHCWGHSQPLRLTRSTATRLKAGVLLKDLPKTFQDAILVTRNMQIRYLWIDSLCITQDDPRDWHREATLMRNVYSRAICCIAATAAKDSDVGLFFYRDPQDHLPIGVGTSRARIHGQKTDEPLVRYTIHSEVVTATMAIDNAPLNQRAWVAQERYLSTRTVHFTQDLIFWECRESVTSEQDPGGSFIGSASALMETSAVHALKSNICDYWSRMAIMSGSPTSVERLNVLSYIHEDWCRFRTSYSGLSLTKEEDIFVALNGIAKTVAEVTNDTLVAGLWRGRLIEELCWKRHTKEWVHSIDEPPRPSTWRAPTWSWASINRIIEGRTMWWEHDCWLGFIHEMAAIEDLAVDQKPSGQLVNASLTLTCRLIPISPPDSGIWAWTPYKGTVVLDDCTITNAKDLGDEISLVILRHFARGKDGGVQGMLVLPSQVKSGSYERLGYFQYEVKSLGHDLNDFKEEKRILQSVLDGYHNAQETTIELI